MMLEVYWEVSNLLHTSLWLNVSIICSPYAKCNNAHVNSLRDYFLKTLSDTDATDFTEFRGKKRNKKALTVISVKSAYKKGR